MNGDPTTADGSGGRTHLRRALSRGTGFRLEVDPIGSGYTHLTERIHLAPGDVLVLDVGGSLRMTTWRLR